MTSFFRTALLSTALALTSFAAQAETVLNVASWLPPAHPIVSDALTNYAKKVEEASEGRVKLNILSAPLAPPPGQYDLAVNGVADIAYGVQGYTPGRFKTASITEGPFLGNSATVTSVAYWRTFEKMLKDAGEYDDVKVLAVFTHGPGEAFIKGRDLSDLSSFEGAKIRVGGGLVHEVATALGSVPVEGPSSKTYELLSQKVADGIFFPPESVNFFGLIPLLDQALFVEGGLYNTSFFVVMNKAKWDSLPDEDKAAIDSVSGEALARQFGQMWDRVDAEGVKAMDGKVTIHEATAEQMDVLKEKLQPVIDASLEDFSKSGLEGKEALDVLKSEIEKAAAE